MLPRSRFIAGLGALSLILMLSSAALSAPATLVSVVSRMAHGTAGAFDIQLTATGDGNGSGIECRNVAGGMNIILTFDQPITSADAFMTAGNAEVNGNPTFSGNVVTVKLNQVMDAQTANLTVSSIVNNAGEWSESLDIPFRVLMGDVNGSGSVTATDVNLVSDAVSKSQSVNGGNFRCDYNFSGSLTAADVNSLTALASQNGSVEGGSTTNTPPTISTVPNQQAVTGIAALPAGFTVGDAESDPATLYVTASSSDPATIPLSGIALAGTGAARTVTITPAAGITTVTPVTITMTASDGLTTSAPGQFVVTVVPPPTVYLATLTPLNGTVKSLGSGYATLQVSGDKTYAILRFSVSNLAGAVTDEAVYAPGDDVLYDVPVGRALGHQQPDGSFKWVFSAAKAAAINNTIAGGTAYMTIQTVPYPAGELKGIFKKVTGSQTFTPPPDPPAITINPPTKYDASRLLQQGAFGGKILEIDMLSNPDSPNAETAINDWIVDQMNMPGPIYPTYAAAAIRPATQPANPPATTQPTLAPLGPQSASQPYTKSSMFYQIWGRVCLPQSPLIYGDTLDNNRIHEAWWKNAVTAPDQLRQRVATALSEIFVVSEIDTTINANLMGLATYHDMLANDAFGNFRTLLKDVTLHPIMGQYLNMRGNRFVTGQSPNENYAREILQLFSIGLYQLQPDGTLMLDANGQPMPTYDQSAITNFAHVFTGWDLDTAVVIPTIPATTQPVAPVVNVNSRYQKPMIVTAGNHSRAQKTLLQYSGAARYVPTTQPGVIPATTSMTGAVANAELDFAIDNIFNHPNVGPFICRQLIQRLVSSNPSPGYVYRVAKVFANDGNGVRGNMRAVITAILTDYEARNNVQLGDPGYGHCREPMIRIASMLRSLGAWSKSGKWLIGKTDNTLQQTVFRSPTVFNFFDPHYAEPGIVSDAGIVSPELNIIYSTTITASQNMIYTGIYSHNYSRTAPTGTGFRGDANGSDVYLDFGSTGCYLQPLVQNSGQDAMVDQVALLLMGSPLDPQMKSIITTFLSTKLESTAYLNKVKAAVHLVATSPQAATQK